MQLCEFCGKDTGETNPCRALFYQECQEKWIARVQKENPGDERVSRYVSEVELLLKIIAEDGRDLPSCGLFFSGLWSLLEQLMTMFN